MTIQTRREVSCETCGISWRDHTPICSRHAFRPARYRDPDTGEWIGDLHAASMAAAVETIGPEIEGETSIATACLPSIFSVVDHNVWVRRDEVAGMLRGRADFYPNCATRSDLREAADEIEAGGKPQAAARNGEARHE